LNEVPLPVIVPPASDATSQPPRTRYLLPREGVWLGMAGGSPSLVAPSSHVMSRRAGIIDRVGDT